MSNARVGAFRMYKLDLGLHICIYIAERCLVLKKEVVFISRTNKNSLLKSKFIMFSIGEKISIIFLIIESYEHECKII